MFPIVPPTGPFLLNFGFLQLRWYGVWIVGGAILAAYLSSRRAERRGFDPEDVWNQLMIGMIISVACARAYYVAFEWRNFADKPWWYTINPQNGGIAIHGALIGIVISSVAYSRWRKLPYWRWVDTCLPTVLVAQAVGRLGNFFNQEAYGRVIDGNFPPFGLRIEEQYRLEPYKDIQRYPYLTTYFHATFLYELVWNLVGFGLIMWLERRLRGWRRVGDMAAFYALVYGSGRLWIEGLRVDSLCTNGVGGSCNGSLRAAQIASLVLIVLGVAGLIYNHTRNAPLAAPIEDTPFQALPQAEPISTDGAEPEEPSEPRTASEGGRS